MNLLELRDALEASWDVKTSYLGVSKAGNPALGQCYPTSCVIQQFFPAVEVVEGEVWTGTQIEKHFWNLLMVDGEQYVIDFTWQQFPFGSSVRSYIIRDRASLGDSRCDILRERVVKFLAQKVTALDSAA